MKEGLNAVSGVSDRLLDVLQDRLCYQFDDLGLLREALVHRSWLNESGDSALRSNERLEHLGDAALEAFITLRLFIDFPDATEGWLTTARSSLVRNRTLAEIGRELRLGDCLSMSAGISRGGGRDNDHILSCALEAVVGAVWLDGGDEAARELISRLFDERIESISGAFHFQDAKSRLQHFTQSSDGTMPAYRIVSESGPSHDPVFLAEVSVFGNAVAQAEGRSKQLAELTAAQRALEMLGADDLA